MADVKVNEGVGPRIDTAEVVGEDGVTRHQQVIQIAGEQAEYLWNQSAISQGNKCDRLLAANEQFIGEWEEVTQYSVVKVLVQTDAWSAINGAIAQFSTDGVNVAREITTTIVGGPTGGSFSFAPLGPFFRLVYTNGAAAQTVFYNSVVYDKAPSTPTQLMLPHPLDDRYTATIVRSIIAGKNPSGAYVNLNLTENGELRQAITSFDADVPIAALTGFQSRQFDVQTGSGTIADPPMTGRKTISVKALLTNTGVVYVGQDATVSTATGFPLSAGEAVELEVSDAVSLYAIGSEGTQRVATLEVA